jgi:periplasmic protein CpxP/Spy
MNTMRKMVSGLVMAASLAAASASVLAQTPPSAPGAAPAASGQQGQRMSPEQREARMKEHFDRFSRQLHDKLKLNANQEQAWNTYLQSMTPPARQERPDRAKWESMTTPQRMEQHLARMKEHEAQMSKRLESTKAFYGQLNADQQKVFDAETAKMMKGMHGHNGHHGDHHGGKGGAGRGQPQGAPQPK